MRKIGIAPHTPGPWSVDACSERLMMNGETLDVGPVELSPARAEYPEALGNLALISAAPDLLAALTEVLAVTDPLGTCYWSKRARRALEKATRAPA